MKEPHPYSIEYNKDNPPKQKYIHIYFGDNDFSRNAVNVAEMIQNILRIDTYKHYPFTLKTIYDEFVMMLTYVSNIGFRNKVNGYSEFSTYFMQRVKLDWADEIPEWDNSESIYIEVETGNVFLV